VSPEDLKALRSELKCTAKELARTLGLEQATVLAWEKGELFPTKAVIGQMGELRARGPAAIVRVSKKRDEPLRVLGDADFQVLLRKLLAHKALRDAAAKLSESYDDPLDQA
jgi:transcriptional regulator with XRE-family HTH domain